MNIVIRVRASDMDLKAESFWSRLAQKLLVLFGIEIGISNRQNPANAIYIPLKGIIIDFKNSDVKLAEAMEKLSTLPMETWTYLEAVLVVCDDGQQWLIEPHN